MIYLFDEKRFITAGVNEKISPEIQLLMWNIIDKLKSERIQLDYLQVFELEVANDGTQIIVNHQEIPERINAFKFKIDNPIKTKVWIIDSEEYSMMLFPSEY